MTQARNEAEDYRKALLAERSAYVASGRADRVADVDKALGGPPVAESPAKTETLQAKEVVVEEPLVERAVDEPRPQPRQPRRPSRRGPKPSGAEGE